MIKSELEDLEKQAMELLVTRRQLGGYNSEAETIIQVCNMLFKIVQHLKEQASRKK